jgi:hypothetical protein
MAYAFEHDGTATGIAMRATKRGREGSLIAMVLGDRVDARTFDRLVRASAPIRILSIDAWRDAGGWYWNAWYKVGECPLSTCDLKPRALLRYMRDAEFLGDGSKGRVSIEDDGHNVVILAKGTREPLFALEYGSVAP